ncbi:MAG: NifU family protein [Vicingaceae bacterium]
MKFITNIELTRKVEGAIQQLRPFFIKDNGDIRLVGIEENMVVRVKLLGACKTCSINGLTLKAGIEDAVKKVAPEIVSVVATDD